MGVLTGDAEYFVSAHALVLGDELAHMADHAGIAAAAAHRLGGHVGAIGFQHNAFQAQGLNGFYRARVPKITLLSNTSCTPHASGLTAYTNARYRLLRASVSRL